MSKGEETKARLVEKTAALIAVQGYHATGLNQITRDSGTPMGSLYYHFRGGKDELVTTAMQASGDVITQAMQQIFAATNDLPSAIRSVVRLLGEQLETSAFTMGCPIATVTLETAAQNDTIQATSQSIYRTWQAQIAAFLVKLGYPQQQAIATALFSLVVIEGGLLLSRAERSTQPLEEASELLIGFLDADPHKGG